MEITIGKHKFQLDHTVHVDQQEWRKHLVFVSTVPNRLVGLVDPDETDFSGNFMLYAAVMYVSELVFSPILELDPDTRKPVMKDGAPVTVGMNARTKLQILVPYDVMSPIDVRVWPSFMMHVHEQGEGWQKWMFERYLNLFDEPRVELAQPGLIHKP